MALTEWLKEKASAVTEKVDKTTELVRKNILKVVADTRTKIQTLKALHEEYRGTKDESLKGSVSKQTEGKVMKQMKAQEQKTGVQKNILEKAAHAKLYEEFKEHKAAIKTANEPIRGTENYKEAKENVVKNAELIVKQLNEGADPQREAIKQELIHFLRQDYETFYRNYTAKKSRDTDPNVIKKAEAILYRLHMRKDLEFEVYKLLVPKPKKKTREEDAFAWMDKADKELKTERAQSPGAKPYSHEALYGRKDPFEDMKKAPPINKEKEIPGEIEGYLPPVGYGEPKTEPEIVDTNLNRLKELISQAKRLIDEGKMNNAIRTLRMALGADYDRMGLELITVMKNSSTAEECFEAAQGMLKETQRKSE